MERLEAIQQRHSVRQYLDKPIEPELVEKIQQRITEINEEGHLHLQLIQNEPKAFKSFLARYGRFTNVQNYIACIGEDTPDLDEKIGYYGEDLVIYAQQLGLNTCWVGGTYKKMKEVFEIGPDEKLVLVISIGYGENQGKAHKGKQPNDVIITKGDVPEWFENGVEAALMAPTAVNQQKFTLEYDGEGVIARAGRGFYSKVDLGIIKYHFEVGAGRDIVWK